MKKKFIKDNRGQVLYAVVVTVMFVGVLSMITMGMTLKNYQNAVKKQENIQNYYAADAVVEKIRVGAIEINSTDYPIGEPKELSSGSGIYVTLMEMTEKEVLLETEDSEQTPTSEEMPNSEDPEQDSGLETEPVIKTTVTEHFETYCIEYGSVVITAKMKVVTETQKIVEEENGVGDENNGNNGASEGEGVVNGNEGEVAGNAEGEPVVDEPGDGDAAGQENAGEAPIELPAPKVTRTIISWEVSYNAG